MFLLRLTPATIASNCFKNCSLPLVDAIALSKKDLYRIEFSFLHVDKRVRKKSFRFRAVDIYIYIYTHSL